MKKKKITSTEQSSSFIHRIKIKKKFEGCILSCDNILHPSIFYEQHIRVNSIIGELKQWRAYTTSEKSCLLLLYANNFTNEIEGVEKNVGNVDKAINYIISKIPFDGVVMGDKYIFTSKTKESNKFDFNEMFGSYSTKPFDETNERMIDEFLDVVNDDSKFIYVCQGGPEVRSEN